MTVPWSSQHILQLQTDHQYKNATSHISPTNNLELTLYTDRNTKHTQCDRPIWDLFCLHKFCLAERHEIFAKIYEYLLFFKMIWEKKIKLFMLRAIHVQATLSVHIWCKQQSLPVFSDTGCINPKVQDTVKNTIEVHTYICVLYLYIHTHVCVYDNSYIFVGMI